jgi:pimeloyl-ACP methyl ester carboxylesterase
MLSTTNSSDLAGMSLGVDDHGRGVPVILLHGFPLSAEIWSPVRPALEDVARLVTPDLPGFGRSAKPASGYAMDEMAECVVRLADVLGLERFVLGGHSMGGYVAMRVAAAAPGRVAGLLLVDTRAGADGAEARQRRDAAISSIRAGGRQAFLDGFVQTLIGPSTRRRAPRVEAELRELASEVPDHVLVGALEGMRDRPDSTDVLRSLDVPALFVAGDEDLLAPPDVAEQMRREMRQARLEIILETGHTPSVERPVATAAVMVAFLRREFGGS